MIKRLGALGPLLGAAVVVTLLLPLVHVLLNVPPTEFELLAASYVPSVFVLLWITDDAHRRRCTPCYDFGFLMWYLFPFSLLGYLVWTRGWWGLAVFGVLLAVMYGTWIVSGMLALLLSR